MKTREKIDKGWLELSTRRRGDMPTRLRFKLLSMTDKYATDFYKGYLACINDLERMGNKNDNKHRKRE